MAKNELRLSQLIRTFGPGSMVDLPAHSVVVGGLEQWEMRGEAFVTLSEPRLQARLEQFLKGSQRLDEGARLSLRMPPAILDTRAIDTNGVTAPIFPAWFVCNDAEPAEAGTLRRRRLVRWRDLDAKTRDKFQFEDGRKSSRVTPIRFVAACPSGHLQDINWIWVVHAGTCGREMWLEEKGTSADPADTSIVCACGKRISLQDAFQPGRLGKCRGERPWLLDRDPAGCDQNLKLLTRTATNTYFPQVYTVISLPSEDDELAKLVDEVAGRMTSVKSIADVAMAKRFVDEVGAALGPYDDADIFDRLTRLREGAEAGAKGSAKLAEFDLLACGRPQIGHDHPKSKLFAETLSRTRWDFGSPDLDVSAIKSLVAVHRLREVSALYGFTRFEAAPSVADDGVEDVQLAVLGSPISKGADWLPAVEQFGEGLFIHFDPDAITAWLAEADVARRHDKLVAGFAHWRKRFTDHPPSYPGTPYVLLHSLSHALMSEIAIDCGYPSSALKERIYALPGQPDRFGVLIYTASPGAQGTLGGLVSTAPRFAAILRGALERLAVCSNDPVCADHEPDDRSGDRATHGAACHGCLLIAETSCELRNQSLDRTLLVSTMSREGAEFFDLAG
ncbi:MAG TPA: DUF1998 domain-containing protein [Caulobacteraceae bacterium]|nr:DUF1998 domain-containing protein [Caulobacteraceae bacterium]